MPQSAPTQDPETAKTGESDVPPRTANGDAPAGTKEATSGESPSARARRHALRTRLHAYALLSAALFAVVIAVAASNTAPTKVSWLFGTSHVGLVWLVLGATLAGWLLGVLTVAHVHRRTRAPRTPRARRGGSAKHVS